MRELQLSSVVGAHAERAVALRSHVQMFCGAGLPRTRARDASVNALAARGLVGALLSSLGLRAAGLGPSLAPPRAAT